MNKPLTRCIFIDPTTQMVDTRFVLLDYEAMLSIVGCESVETTRLPSGDILWFDGEPVEYDVVLDGIEIAGVPVLGSNCMITGPDDLETEVPTDCLMTEADVLSMIQWMPRRKIIGETFRDTPTGGVVEYVFEQT
jgi:hypothetical protein